MSEFIATLTVSEYVLQSDESRYDNFGQKRAPPSQLLSRKSKLTMQHGRPAETVNLYHVKLRT